MTFTEDEQKQMLADAVQRGEERRAQNKKVVRIVGIVAVLAVVVLAVQMITRDKGARLPMDLNDPEGTVALWTSEGFVTSIDRTAAKVVVDESVWKEISHDEKTTIVAFLGSYCAAKRGAGQAAISIRGNTSQVLLGAIDSLGMSIN